MDGVESGTTYTVTRDGRAIGQLIPLRPRRTFVPRSDLLAGPELPWIDVGGLRREFDRSVDGALDDPYAR